MPSPFSVLMTISALCIAPITFAQQYYNVHLEVLGYSKKSKRFYVLRSPVHSQSTASLYYYDLKRAEYYFTKSDNSIAQADDPAVFEQQLIALKKELEPLIPVDTKKIKLNILQQDETKRESDFPTLYSTQFVLNTEKFQTQPQYLVHYTPDIRLQQAYVLPKRKGILATFSSLTYPFDEGFQREESVILLPALSK